MRNQDTPVANAQHDSFWPHLFDPFRDIGYSVANFFTPTAEASDNENCYKINLELPGVSENDISVSLQDNMLTIKGEKKSEREEKDTDYYFSERRYGNFQRSFRLPSNSSTDNINASFSDGILTISIPKIEVEKSSERKINVERG